MQERTVQQELAILQVIPAADPRLRHLGHTWEWCGHHRYRCRQCRTEAHDPDAVVLSCDELQADQHAVRVNRNWQPHQYRPAPEDAWQRYQQQRRVYRKRRRAREVADA